MDITFFLTRDQLDTFLNSRYRSTVLLNGKKGETDVLKDKNGRVVSTLSRELENVLDQIIITKELVDPVIERYIDNIQNKEIVEILRYNNVFSSWREKSLLMRLSALAIGHEFTHPQILAACAVELLGMSFCIIDDVIDETHDYLSQKTVWQKYGPKESICASEILSVLATNSLIDCCDISQVDKKDFNRIIDTFEKIKFDTYISQYMDVSSEKFCNSSEEEYYKMISKFPGTLYSNALEIIGLLTNAKHKQVQLLKEFGRLFAMANQIRDDLVEIVGEEHAIGKKIGSDILLKKKRLPIILFLRLNGKIAHEFHELDLTEDHLELIISEMKSGKVIEFSIQQINRLIKSALSKLDKIGKNKWIEILKDLTLFLAEFDIDK